MRIRTLPLLFTLVLSGAACRDEAPQAPEPAPEATATVVREVPPDTLAARLAAERPPLVLDVRTPEEYAGGHVPGALNIPHTEVAARLGELAPYRDREIVLYCRSGRRAGIAADVLKEAGFSRLAHLSGDMPGWAARGLPVEQ
ncbi:rhodanese-like domain-containing protein [Rhodocaloribacter litoris]|uniref:rhodanese-like domain-containing protein n=1 Tax=Rhodocaloribacter litoris TaxID=2558931 RepID=UPI00142080D1|nr:rhodanese-like domain-containing protein [Rhodocaloribacter litoris]QXD13778.1 rhodanese-like domain-containing protein [Rhodocaloribacter litoris]